MRLSRSIKRIKKKTPGGKTVIHTRKRKPSHAKCGVCGTKLNRKRLRPVELKKLPKVKRRPERPLPHLCPRCMREYFKDIVRSGSK
jgi:large subunit ribosomal protein L34e